MTDRRRARTHISAFIGVALGLLGAAHADDAMIFVAGGAIRVPVDSIQSRKFATVIRQQYDFSCGSAALATLLTHHYRRTTTETDAFRAMWEVGDQARIRELGFSLFEMKAYLESRGLQADGFRISVDRLAEIGAPGIALIEENGYRHFVVVKGISARRVLVGDPSKGVGAIDRARFAKIWDGAILYVRSEFRTGKDNFNTTRDWALAPGSPFDRALDGESLAGLSLEQQTRPSFSGFAIPTFLEGGL